MAGLSQLVGFCDSGLQSPVMDENIVEYSSSDLTRRFNITGETLRQWTIRAARWLSPGARPTGGSHRRFSFADLEALTLVYELRSQNAKWDDILERLEAGERGVPAIDPASLVPLESQKQLAMLYEMIERFKAEKADLEARLTAATTRADRAEGAQDSLKAQLEETRRELQEAYKRIGRLEADT